jgi:hypothetical protein
MLNRIAAGLAGIAVAAFLAVPAAPALASPADQPSCSARTTCMYQATSYSGGEQDYYNPDNGDGWVNLPIGERASVIAGGASDVWYWNEAAGLYECVPGNTSVTDLSFPGGFGDPGWMFIDYGVTDNCAEAAPSGAPGS